MKKSWRALASAGALVMLSACGGGESPRMDTPAAAVAAAAELRTRTADALAQRRVAQSAARVEAVTAEAAVDQLLDFAEAQFPQFFPSHQPTLSSPPFRYRHYAQTGVYLGVVVTPGMGYEADGVYAMGGSFGSSPVYIGPLRSLLDSDRDGVPDGDDVSPLDALCSAASDAHQGQCHLRSMAGTRVKVVGNGGGKLFFSAEGDSLQLYAYDLKTAHFLGRTEVAGFAPTAYAYSADHGRLYVGDATGTIHTYSKTLIKLAQPLANISTRVNGLTAAGKYLVVQDGGFGFAFDRQGRQAARPGAYLSLASTTSEWNPAQSRLYYLHFYSPGDLIYLVVDQATGGVSASGDSPYHGDYTIRAPIRANPSGSHVLLGSGDLYAAPGLTWAAKIPVTSMIDAMWLRDDEVLVASGSTGRVRLQRFSVGPAPLEVLEMAGELLAMAQHEGVAYLVTRLETHVAIRRYVPSNDTDGDGVDNQADRFPFDPAAAVDSDSDGHPDAWIGGRTAADSTTGLTLDAYPQDAACYAPSQGKGGNCDPTLHAPAGPPDRVFSDDQGTVFMYSRSQGRIHRWSLATDNYIEPLAVGQPDGSGELRSPRTVAYSAEHRRIYLGYDSGQITYIDAAGYGAERIFGTVSTAVGGFGAAGRFLLVQDYSGIMDYSTHSVFDKAGALIDSKGMNYFSRHYEWVPSRSRLYFFGDDFSPNDLLYEQINQATGKIESQGQSPHHGDYAIRGPIRAAPDGGRIVLGTGDIFDTTDLMVVKSLATTWVDQQWLADGRLAGLSLNGVNSRVTVYTSALAVQREHPVDGQPLGLIVIGTDLAVVTQLGATTRVTRLTP